MKNFLSLTLIFVFSFAFSQSLEEKSTQRACECLKQYQTVEKEQISSCINQGIAKSLEESTNKKDKKRFKNMMEAVQIIKTVQKMVLENCLTKKDETTTESHK